MTNCQWCDLEYELDANTEREHLKICPVFQTLPVAQMRDGKTFVALPGYPDILCERTKVQ